jgi:hypothetical protein
MKTHDDDPARPEESRPIETDGHASPVQVTSTGARTDPTRGREARIADLIAEWRQHAAECMNGAEAHRREEREASRQFMIGVQAGYRECASALEATLQGERDATRAELLHWESREAECCPEDVGFEEWIAVLKKQKAAAEQQIAALTAACAQTGERWRDAVDRAEQAEQRRADLTAAIERLARYRVSELDGMLLPNPVQDGEWVPWSRIRALLTADPTSPGRREVAPPAETWHGIERILELLKAHNITDTDILKHTLEDAARWHADLLAGRMMLIVEAPSSVRADDGSTDVDAARAPSADRPSGGDRE